MAANPTNRLLAFDALDRDWHLLCHQHRRRTGLVTRWAQHEPALATARNLADVIPPPGEDRTPTTAAVARLHVGGDDVASRTLLQLVVPGLTRLTAKWRHRFPGGTIEAAEEIISRAGIYIAYLRRNPIRCAPAGYIVTSINRDLSINARRDHPTIALDSAAADRDTRLAAPSAEQIVASGPLVHDVLNDLVDAGIVSPQTAELVWLVLTGHTVPHAAETTATPKSTAYRQLATVAALLHRHLTDHPG